MNLSETDKERIANIEKYLVELSRKYNNDLPIDEFKPQPAVDVVEPEYVRCDYSADNHVTEGKAYKVQKVTVNHIYIIDRTGAIVGYPHSYFSSITKEEFDRQQPIKEVEKEWKVGQWAWLGKGKYVIGLITEINGIKATADDQNGFVVKGLNIDEFTQPTENEIFTHLKGIAERKYPVGTKVKPLWGNYAVWDVETHNFAYDNGRLYVHDKSLATITTLWTNIRGWAEISEPKQEERWNIAIVKNHSKYEVRVTGIDNQELAQSAATKIREILLGV